MHATKEKLRRCFTLIELLVVIAIIALLLSIITPSLKMAREHARRITCTVNLKTIGLANNTYASEMDGELALSLLAQGTYPDAPSLTYYAYFIYNNSGYTSEQIRNLEHLRAGPFNLAWLYQTKYMEQAELFYCPSATRIPETELESHHYDAYHDEAHPWPWNTNLAGNNYNLDKVRTSYTYVPQKARGKDRRGFKEIAKKASELDASTPICTDVLASLEQLSHRKGGIKGVNALYSDSSVKFVNNAEAFDPMLWEHSPNNDWVNFRTIISLLR
ncbi:MAG: hypothetical protein BWY87_00342 [Deltaproteobacteria bacterium ADurb.Bin510]|nr:MAG: hypothetical protein BWY87_00342 [Deltaproteobacteria bacterium ADurb.Bin510]